MYIHEFTVKILVYLFTFQFFSLSHKLCEKSGSLEIMSECLPLRQLLREDLTLLFSQILQQHTHNHTHTHSNICTQCTHIHVHISVHSVLKKHSVTPSILVAYSCREKRERDREGGGGEILRWLSAGRGYWLASVSVRVHRCETAASISRTRQVSG